MGRLDDAAKYKVVELRKAGLSFRKIKAVLELENIKVSAQAIYLFLREFQGRPPGRVRPVEAGSSTSQPPARQESWTNLHLQNLLREASHHAGFTADFTKQTNSEAASNSSGSAESVGGSRSEQQQREGSKEENDIQIVSVTSLAQQSQQRAAQSSVRPETGAASSLMRRRVTPSPATSSMLAARKRLLDKALSHRMKSFHQVASMLRRDHSGVQGADLRSALPQQPETYDLTTDKTVMEAQPGGGPPRRFLPQRPGQSVRSLHPPPRVGIRLPTRPLAPLASSAPGAAVIRLQAPGAQAGRSEGNPSPQQAVQEAAGRGLQEQVQTLGSEVRSLGLAVKMLVEQQCRLEREQVQQTQIQRQILSTLQTLASRAGQRSSAQQQHDKTPSPSAPPAPASFSQDSFSFSPGSFPPCSLDGLESVEAFKLPGLSPAGINGFPPCSSADSLPLTHTPPQPPPYAAAYPQQSPALMAPYSQPYSAFSQTQTFRAAQSKASDFPSSCSVSSFQDCSVSTAAMMSAAPPPQDQQLSIIKVEGP